MAEKNNEFRNQQILDTRNKIYQQYMEFEGADDHDYDNQHYIGHENPYYEQIQPPPQLNFNFDPGLFPQIKGPSLFPDFGMLSNAFSFPMPVQDFSYSNACQSEQVYYRHKEETEDELTDYDIKMNKYILHIKPEKLLVYQNHLFKVMQPRKIQIDINIENLPPNVHYSHIIEFFEFNGVHTEPKQIYVKIRGFK